MRAEKKYLSEEVGSHLAKSDYVFIANYTRATVPDLNTLRSQLRKEQAEFHVVKNSALRAAARAASYPELGNLEGQNAIIVGGRNPSAVAKIVREFFKTSQKIEVRGGVMGKKLLAAGDIDQLADLPPLEAVRAQLLGLLQMPSQQFVRVLAAVPGGLVNVLQAKVRKEGGEAA
jgi:large subunit ribosomal protein L10